VAALSDRSVAAFFCASIARGGGLRDDGSPSGTTSRRDLNRTDKPRGLASVPLSTGDNHAIRSTNHPDPPESTGWHQEHSRSSRDVARSVPEEGRKLRRRLAVIVVAARTGSPLVFEKPGTYADGARQKTAFAKGTVYFRHGARSDPGSSRDIARFVDAKCAGTEKSGWATSERSPPHRKDLTSSWFPRRRTPTALLTLARTSSDDTDASCRSRS